MATKDGANLEVIAMEETHNHKVDKVLCSLETKYIASLILAYPRHSRSKSFSMSFIARILADVLGREYCYF